LSAFHDSLSLRRTEEERGERTQRVSEEEREREEEQEGEEEEWIERDERGRSSGRDREGESECDDDTCEHCKLEQTNARAARLRNAQERAADDAAMRTQKATLQALEEKEQVCPLHLISFHSPFLFPPFF
jgi:hypothetical protein